MFEDQTVELLPARTVMTHWGGRRRRSTGGAGGAGGNALAIAVAVNAGNVNFGDDQTNVAQALAVADASGGDGGAAS